MAAGAFTVDDLRNGIERREIVPYFQPIVTLSSGHLWGFEVLSRWRHPQSGVVPPDEFIHLAEVSGLIDPVFDIVISQAFTSLPLSFSSNLTLSINISPSQMQDHTIASKILLTADRAGFPLRQLVVEITESSLIENIEEALLVTSELKTRGVRLGLDDFGTGYSSLLRLNSLSLDEIKIDQSFVRSMDERKETHKIAAAIAGLGNSLGLTTIAEGIEDQQHADMLFYLGCELGQGWLYGRPMPAGELPDIIARAVLAPPAGSSSFATTMASRIEASPAHQLAQLRAIYDGAPVGLGFLDRQLRFVNYNKQLVEMSEAPFGPRQGKTIEEVSPVIYLQLETYLKRALAGEAISNIEILAERPGSPSEVNVLLVSLHPARDEADEIVGISMSETNVTSRRHVEQLLREEEDHYRLTTELNANFPFRANADGNVVWAGRSGVSGRPMNELLGQNWRDIVHPDDLFVLSREWEEAIRTARPFLSEFRVRGADGTWHWARARTSPRRSENGNVIAWYGLVEDITGIKQAQRKPDS